MKTEVKLFTFVTAFFLITALAYGYVTDWEEPVGLTALLLSAGLGAMIAFYLWNTARHLPPRPDDNPDAHISDQAGDYGAFAPFSWWPLWLGLAASVIFLGMAVGWWLFLLGIVFGLWALIGWVYEFYKGAPGSPARKVDQAG